MKRTLLFFIVLSGFFSYTITGKEKNSRKEKKLKQTKIFSSLEDIKKFTQNNPQYPDIDNQNWRIPDYTSFYKEKVPSKWQKTLNFFGIKKLLWSASTFKKLLKNVTAFREAKGQTGRFVQRIHPTAASKFFIWGETFGAFDSIQRSLEYLEKKKIISKHLKILDKNTYFVFNGNVIDLSPYSLETLTIILKLIEINPEQVIYLKGSHEEKETWLSYGLKTELEIKAAHVSNEKIPLKKLINRFFRTLPLALYLTDECDGKLCAVRISYPGRDYPELNEENFPQLFENTLKHGQAKLFNLKNIIRDTDKKSERGFEVKTIIKAPKQKIPTFGFATATAEKGSTTFILFSSPTKTFRAMDQFFYDAFALLATKEKFKDWTISLYNQDVKEREDLGFHRIKTYNIATGQVVSKEVSQLKKKIIELEKKLETKQETTKKKLTAKYQLKTPKEPAIPEIQIGSILDTTGLFASIGKSIQKGLYARLKDTNLKLEIVYKTGKPSGAIKNIKKLLAKNIKIMLSPMAISSSKEICNLARETKEILFLFPVPSLQTNVSNIINFGPTFKDIAHFSVSYAKNVEQAQKFAFFYQQELFSDTILEITKRIPKEKYIGVDYTSNTISLQKQAKKIRDFRPHVLFLWGTPEIAKNIITEIKPMHLTDTIIMGYQLGTKEFKDFLKKNNLIRQYVGIENTPNPLLSKLEIMQEYRKHMTDDYISIFSAQAYIVAGIAADILQHIKPPITQEKIISYIENLKHYNFKGLELNFNKKTRSLSEQIWIDKNQNTWENIQLKPTMTTQFPNQIPNQISKSPEEKCLSVRKDAIEIGTTMDLKGAVRGVSLRTLKAIEAVFYLTNKAGGIRGKNLKIVEQNDLYNPKIAKKNIENFINNLNIDIILNPVGGATTQSYTDLIKKGKVLVLFPSTGSPSLRNPNLTYMIHFRPSYSQIQPAAIQYLLKNENVKKVVFVYQDDAASGNSVNRAIEKNNLNSENYIKIPYIRGQQDFTNEVKQILDFDPDAIAFWCQALVMQKIIKEIGAPNLKNKLLLTTEMGSSSILNYMKKIGLAQNFINTENIPGFDSQIEIMKEYRQYLKLPDPFLEETYISTSFFVHILKQIEPPITKEKIIRAIENTKNYNFKGFELNFNPKNRELSQNIWIYKAGKEIAKIPV